MLYCYKHIWAWNGIFKCLLKKYTVNGYLDCSQTHWKLSKYSQETPLMGLFFKKKTSTWVFSRKVFEILQQLLGRKPSFVLIGWSLKTTLLSSIKYIRLDTTCLQLLVALPVSVHCVVCERWYSENGAYEDCMNPFQPNLPFLYLCFSEFCKGYRNWTLG